MRTHLLGRAARRPALAPAFSPALGTPTSGWAGSGKTTRVRRGEPAARVAGPPGELLLYLFGRRDAAHVDVSGLAAAVEAVRHARFGM
jgi:hypothetical protein